MIKKFTAPILIFIPLVLLQLTVVPLISYNNIGPDLIILPVIYFSIKKGQMYGMVLGFIIGFMFDLISGGIIGSSMFSKTLAGFIAGYFFNENKIDLTLGSVLFMFIVFICSSVDSLIISILSASENISTLSLFIIKRSLLPGLYSSAFSLPSIIYNNKIERLK
ncbi:MAG: rod shape-determining protein MreD [bacterium]